MLVIEELIKNAIKSKESIKLNVYRSIKAEITNFKTAKNAKPYEEADEIQLLKKMCKQREDSIKQYLEAGREDLVLQESNELEVIKKLLPKPVNELQILIELNKWSETNKFLEWDEHGGTLIRIPKKSLGITIKHLKSVFPAADGKLVSDVVKRFIY